LRGADNHRVDYRHVIDWLVRKPGAFARYCYQADLFPTSRFRQAYDELARTQSERVASRTYLEILQLAARGSEGLVDGALARLLAQQKPIGVAAMQALLDSDTDLSLTALVQVPAVTKSWRCRKHGLLRRHARRPHLPHDQGRRRPENAHVFRPDRQQHPALS
jgi:hypothetical protein